LKEALQKYEKTEEPGKAAEPDHAQPIEALDKLKERGCTHTCPMPEHFHVCGKGPEKCPDCGMTLEPIEQLKTRFGGGP
jgi:hypothetical protein